MPERLDKALVRRGLARSRTEAQALLAAGQVVVNGRAVAKASVCVDEAAAITVQGGRLPFVSRGGLKLQAALETFGITVTGRTALDVGASTGGWTDCLLQRGARRVVALDVGHGQMAPGIAADPRVELREGVNARFLSPQDFASPFDLIVADLSFISLTLVLPALVPLLTPGGDLVCLVKPQFEVGVEKLGRGGVVRNADARREALRRVVAAAQSLGLRDAGRMDSPILGMTGNQEFLEWLVGMAEGHDGVERTEKSTFSRAE